MDFLVKRDGVKRGGVSLPRHCGNGGLPAAPADGTATATPGSFAGFYDNDNDHSNKKTASTDGGGGWCGNGGQKSSERSQFSQSFVHWATWPEAPM